jgi:hypothetical protein
MVFMNKLEVLKGKAGFVGLSLTIWVLLSACAASNGNKGALQWEVL